MKKTATLLISLALVAGARPIQSQSAFSPEAYMHFRAEHRNYSAEEILSDNPPLTTYYSGREHPANLADIPWYDSLDRHFQFTDAENELLRQNHFMVSERLSQMDWAGSFIGLYSADLPLFISSDFILSTLHNSYDAILQTVELEYLEPNLKALLAAMYARVPALVDKYRGDARLDDAVKDMDLFISVARSLAEGTTYSPRIADAATYTALMDAIASESLAVMPLFTSDRTRNLDFSQFTPRGHYKKDIYTPDGVRTLEDYFRAMMWLGRIDFLLTAPPENPWEKDWEPEELRRMQQGALLVNECLYSCGKQELLEAHEAIISFLVGPDDHLTPAELSGLEEELLESPADLFSESSYAGFTAALNASDDYGQRIMSNFFLVDPDSTDPGQLPVSYKLLGQKFLIDSYVFSELVYDRISHEGKKVWRPLPDPLDVMAALGNEDALALLKDEMESYHYAPNMAGLQYMVSAYDDDFWEQSLYNTWLAALRELNPAASDEQLPYFMRTSAWHQEKLNTQLTSWAQLRHDNILYGKQSYTGGTGCSYPFSYVEPYPGLYARLSDFASRAEAFFSGYGERFESAGDIGAFYEQYGSIMDRLETISMKELEGQAISEDEIVFLKTMISDYMASGPSISGWYMDLFYDGQKALWTDFTVADVHTQPTDAAGNVMGNVLHVGNGLINMGVFFAGNPCKPGQLMAFAGPVASFHTEVRGNFERLTDQEWEDRFWLNRETHPSRPDWVASYLADAGGMAMEPGRALEGELFKGTGTGPVSQGEALDYMILFPNPSQGSAFLRFVLNRNEDVHIEIFDATGRLRYASSHRNLPAAEHHIPLPVDDWEQGIYMVQTRVGELRQSRKLLKD